MNPRDFISLIAPAAVASMTLSKIPASFTIAEAALESGWGTSGLSVGGHNLFGVKADAGWHGEILLMNTREFMHGKWIMIQAKWRKYPGWFACIADHAAFLTTNPRYKKAFDFCADAEKFTIAVATAGYATDPTYATKIISVIRQHNLKQYDVALTPTNKGTS